MKMWKRISCVLVVFIIMGAARSQSVNDSLSFVEGLPIEVGLHMTTNLVFHYKVRQVDRGTGELLAKLGNDTVLLLKAAHERMPPTNLSVYTADGKLHAFFVRYAPDPAHLWWRQEGTRSNDAEMTEDSLAYYSRKAADQRNVHGPVNKQYGLSWRLRGLYARSNLTFIALEFSNHSPIDYDIGNIRLLIRDRRRARRTATQEREVHALYEMGNRNRIAADSGRIFVLALPAVIITGKRVLRIVISEKGGGGRDLWLNVSPRQFLRVKRL